MSTDSEDSTDPGSCDLCGDAEATRSFGSGSVCDDCFTEYAGGGDTDADLGPKEKVAHYFEKAGLDGSRFVKVKDGAKACHDHDTRWGDPRDVPGENYGIYADKDDQLVILDVDYHEEGGDDLNSSALGALGGLPLTLKAKSPHTPDGDRGGHRIFKLGGDETPAELFEREFGRMNPVPSWGEVIAKNKFVVGPGSQLDGCSKEWCDSCDDPDSGLYRIKKDREIATVDPEELVVVLAADPDLSRKGGNQTLETDGDDSEESGSEPDPRADGTDGDDTADVDAPNRELTRAEVESMLSALPGNQHYDEWIRTGFAVFDWDDGETGQAVFEEWSRSNAKWEEEESQYKIDKIWEDGESGDVEGNASVGTLVHLAKEHGWSRESADTAREVADGLDDDEKMPHWVVRELAIDLDVIPRDALVTKETDEGDEYLGFPGPETQRNALEAIEEEGYSHNWEIDGWGFPTYDVVDNGEIELRIVPKNGFDVKLEFYQNGHREHGETVERGAWENAHKRTRIGGRVADAISGYSEDEIRSGVKSALNDVMADAEGDEWDDLVRSPREEDLRERTEKVVWQRKEGNEADWIVTMEPPAESPIDEPAEILLETGDLRDPNASNFATAHRAEFAVPCEPDKEEWAAVTEWWPEIQEQAEPESDHVLEAACDAFKDWVETVKLVPGPDAFSWDSRNGIFGEIEGEEALLVPGQAVVDWQHSRDAARQREIGEISRKLQNDGFLTRPPKRKSIAGVQRRVWPVDPGKVDLSPSDAIDDDDDDEPALEGLRGE